MERVAAESGVAKTTLYRHWPTKAALCMDLYLDVARRELHDPDTGDVARDLKEVAATVVRLQTRTIAGAALIGLIAEAHVNPETSAPVLAEFAERRRPLTRLVLERGIARARNSRRRSPRASSFRGGKNQAGWSPSWAFSRFATSRSSDMRTCGRRIRGAASAPPSSPRSVVERARDCWSAHGPMRSERFGFTSGRDSGSCRRTNAIGCCARTGRCQHASAKCPLFSWTKASVR